MCAITLKMELFLLVTQITRPEHEVSFDIEWYETNYIKLNQDKCYYPTAGHKHEIFFANLEKAKIWESQEEMFLLIEI